MCLSRMWLLIFNNHTDICTYIAIQKEENKTKTLCPNGGREIENKHKK